MVCITFNESFWIVSHILNTNTTNILFLIYINDIVKSTNYFSVRLFADDTSLTATGKDLDVLLHRINSELPAIYEWLCSNRLTLNLRKTKYLVFRTTTKKKL